MKVLIGDIFESKAHTLVNTVNCVGVMGKGVALEFKKKYPQMYKEYVSLCKNGEITPGKPHYYEDLFGASVLLFPTKDHWKSPSRFSYIEEGLDWFIENYEALGITSIAFPPLGCGNGGLLWSVVGPTMYQKLKDLPIEIEIYAPYGTDPKELKVDFLEQNPKLATNGYVGHKANKINKYWLLILYLVKRLNEDRYSLYVGSVIFQKICYVLTLVGLPTGFVFSKGSYGPYSRDVDNAIRTLSNANLMVQRPFGKMLRTEVTDSFVLPKDKFTKDEMDKVERAFDLLSRIQNTEQAEVVATVLFSYAELLKKKEKLTETDLCDFVFDWKKHWRDNKKEEILETTLDLVSLGWMNLVINQDYQEDII